MGKDEYWSMVDEHLAKLGHAKATDHDRTVYAIHGRPSDVAAWIREDRRLKSGGKPG
jgi:hypothetical protein